MMYTKQYSMQVLTPAITYLTSLSSIMYNMYDCNVRLPSEVYYHINIYDTVLRGNASILNVNYMFPYFI
jgi:hypothetical protein